MFRLEVDERVLHLTLDRPDKRNALLPSELKRLREELLEYADDPTLCAVVVRAQGPFFCAGYDLAAIPPLPADDGRMVGELDDLVSCLAHFPAPTLALVQGGAFGAGFELALACDLRLTMDTARWCMPPAKLGLLYSLDGMCRLQRAVGEQRARYLLMTAEVITGQTAAAWGLVLESLRSDCELARRGAEIVDTLRLVHASSSRSAKIILQSVEQQIEPDLLRRSEALRAELFASAELPPKR